MAFLFHRNDETQIRQNLHRGMGRFVTGSAPAVVGVLLIPTALLCGAIWMVRTITNQLAARLARKRGI